MLDVEVNPWALLLLAISAEVIGTSCLRLSEGMTRPLPTLLVFSAYALAMALLSKVVLSIPSRNHLCALERDRHCGDRAGGAIRLQPDAAARPIDRHRFDHSRGGLGESRGMTLRR